MFGFLVNWIAPLFIITSPLTSYADQIRSIHVTKSSRGFSLDTPLIMLVSSVLRCFYRLGAAFETSLLIQSVIMIFVQLALLKVALDHRPPHHSSHSGTQVSNRPHNFWRWRPQRPYWDFLLYFLLVTALSQLLFGANPIFVSMLGYLALGIEAALPIPQVTQNYKSKSCQGFRLSVLVSWIIGDIMKQVYFYSARSIQVQFKLCAAFQMMMDLGLAVQFWMYGNGAGINGTGAQTLEEEKMELGERD